MLVEMTIWWRYFIDMNEVAFTYLLMYELNTKVCGLMKGLLIMCGVMGLHITAALVD